MFGADLLSSLGGVFSADPRHGVNAWCFTAEGCFHDEPLRLMVEAPSGWCWLENFDHRGSPCPVFLRPLTSADELRLLLAALRGPSLSKS